MAEPGTRLLTGIEETLLVTLYLRAMESRRPDGLIRDGKAEALVEKIGDDGLYDFARIKLLRMSEANKLVLILRSREFDCYARNFVARHPGAAVVHIGCGLDTRFERVDDGQVEWYDLDLPHVIELRRELLGRDVGRHHLLGNSVLDKSWIDAVRGQGHGPFLLLAEGLFMYLEGLQVRSLVLTLREHHAGCELVFDAFSPIHVWRSNLQTARFGFRTRWGIRRGQELERWADGIRLLDEWGFFDEPEPRLAPIRWFRPFDALARTLRIYHFRLGEAR